MHITELSRITGASLDELRYMERKGALEPVRVQHGRRGIREYHHADVRKAQLIMKYRQQGFTWGIAVEKANHELANPTLL
ncbi:MAG: MerR family transcriptional regulator [Dehalococcoidales bacterium]|nr:MerR family transcriptional regulator [Dehalococcoidales bacterium]